MTDIDTAPTQPGIDDLEVKEMPEILIADDELLSLLDRVLETHRVRGFARLAGVTPSCVSMVHHGDRRPNDEIAAALGYRRFSGWEPIPCWKDVNGFFGEPEAAPAKPFIEIED